LPESALETLLAIFNDTWLTGNFPPGWSQATIIPIPKPGKDSTDPGNYRPIALTSCVCRTFERLVNDRIVWYLETNNILTEYQSGFRKQRSAIDHLVHLESFIRESFVRRERVVSVFFDLEKAYNTTWKYGILRDLHEAGLRGRLPEFISYFLANSLFRVRVGSCLSDAYNQQMGVPQGSILSVTLFFFKIKKYKIEERKFQKVIKTFVKCKILLVLFLDTIYNKRLTIHEEDYGTAAAVRNTSTGDDDAIASAAPGPSSQPQSSLSYGIEDSPANATGVDSCVSSIPEALPYESSTSNGN
jgi:hypothetical protein